MIFFPKNKNLETGFAALFIAVLVLVITLGIGISITVFTISEQKISRDVVKSSQAYYAAESGIEDAILRLRKGMSWSSPYKLKVGDAWVTTTISNMVGGTRIITSEGNLLNRIRKVQTVYSISTDEIYFYYGAQIGDGGMNMGNNARVKGNVFSNGSVIAGSGKGYIDNSIVVAHNGNKIKGLEVGQDALVHTCENSTIGGTLTYVSGGSIINCTAGVEIKSRPNEIDPKDLPIPQSQVDDWKNEAAAGGIINSDVTYDNGTVASLGPVQIGTVSSPKNLTVTNNSNLKVTGTIYVTGNIIFSNNVVVELDRDSYGSLGGVIIADGKIVISNNAILRGSGEMGSYILILSTNSSLDPTDPAINVGNNAEGAIFYTNSGLILISNNVKAREITGYKIQLNNNAEVQYESGLENANFSSGTGGSWKIMGWKEVE